MSAQLTVNADAYFMNVYVDTHFKTAGEAAESAAKFIGGDSPATLRIYFTEDRTVEYMLLSHAEMFGPYPAFLPDVHIAIYLDTERSIAANGKLEAIKTVRDFTGMPLKDAKDAVETQPYVYVTTVGDHMAYAMTRMAKSCLTFMYRVVGSREDRY